MSIALSAFDSAAFLSEAWLLFVAVDDAEAAAGCPLNVLLIQLKRPPLLIGCPEARAEFDDDVSCCPDVPDELFAVPPVPLLFNDCPDPPVLLPPHELDPLLACAEIHQTSNPSRATTTMVINMDDRE